MDFSHSLRRLNLDVYLFSCLAALVIITGKEALSAFSEFHRISRLSLYLGFLMETSFALRSSRPQRAQAGRGLSKSPHCLSKGTREWKWIRTEPDATQLSVSPSGQTAWTEDSVHTRPAAHLLPETGGPGASSSDSGENLYGYAAVLKWTKEFKSIKREVFHSTLLNLLLAYGGVLA